MAVWTGYAGESSESLWPSLVALSGNAAAHLADNNCQEATCAVWSEVHSGLLAH